jgi:TPP-dependent pyruvate/acetoin dehydrogenase alpha subunit
MTDAPAKVLVGDPEETDRLLPDASDRDLVALYEALTLGRLLDEHGRALQRAGEIGFWVPAGAAVASSVGAAGALDEQDWFYPSFRDSAAFVIRGGSVEKIVAQLLGSADDLVRGRRVAGQGSLPAGRFVGVSASLAAQVQHAVGTALAMRLRGAPTVALAITGSGAIGQAAFTSAIETASRHDAPAIVVVRGPAAGAAARAEAVGIATATVDGGDVLAVYRAVREARARALESGVATVIEAVIDGASDEDPRTRLRPYLEYRGAWDPEQEEATTARLESRLSTAIETARAAGPPPADTLFDDVYAERTWVQQEQAETRAGHRSDPRGGGR